MKIRHSLLLLLALTSAALSQAPSTQSSRYFTIQVVDEQTGRGVPLVELKTVSSVRYYTDSAGLVAIDDAQYMNREVFFSLFSHGYEYPADGFGMHGTRLQVKPGGSATLKIRRKNIAQRLYRITGEGIYRDSVLLGRSVPISEPLLNAQVTGQDSVQNAVYRNKIYWFWGDTNRQSYPLGHFGTSGATSDLPSSGGLDPSVGVNLTYFTASDGFARPMVPEPKNLLRWIDAVTVLKDENGNEHLVARCEDHKSLAEVLGNRLVMYNDQKNIFETINELPIHPPLQPFGHPATLENDGVSFIYYGEPFPDVRIHADLKSFEDLSGYEGFSCLVVGARLDRDNPPLDRDAQGKLIWGWKKDTQPLNRRQIEQLVRAGKMKADEAWFAPKDVETKKPLNNLAIASVAWNAYRKKWIAIVSQTGGSSSMLGEIWYSEAEKAEGPWPWAVKIITHDRYSFYNPVHHPFLDQEGGRLIYLEGTYASTFSRNEDFTPLYEYNQIMYCLDLGDPRLKLPRD
jgi:hypothetical protein